MDYVMTLGGDPIIDLPGNWGSLVDPYWIKPLFFSFNKQIQSDDYKRMRVTGKPTRRHPVRIGLMEYDGDTSRTKKYIRKGFASEFKEYKRSDVRAFVLWANRGNAGLYTNEDSFAKLFVSDVGFNGQIGII